MRARILLPVLLVGLLIGCLEAEAKLPLSEKHKKWLEEEVVYIISDWEKDLFLALSSEVARDKFIKEFWRLRDPNPATPENEFKIEHYRRIDFANRYFGWDAGVEGWRTDRGRIYIQLGEPQQRIQHRWLGEIRPVELWFYSQNIHPSLPNSFNVMFFRPDAGSEYILYSPYGHGPDKLVKKIGHENDPLGSYRFLRQFDPEIARASMTLLTDEPVDPTQYSPSLTSDSLLARIENLPNDKFTREMLDRRRELNEFVRTRIFYGQSDMEVLTLPFRDARGQTFLHYLLYLPDPLREMVRETNKKKPLSVTVNVLVRDKEENQIFQQRHRNNYSFEETWGWQQELPVAYEDLLPLPPGEYEIAFVLRNELTQTLYQREQVVTVPAFPGQALELSALVTYNEVFQARSSRTVAPFQVSGFKFSPRVEKKFGTNEELQVFFQILDPSAGPQASPQEHLKVEYTLGSLAGGYRESYNEMIPKQEFTEVGVVLHGKSFPLSKFPAGSYRLVVSVTDPSTHERASQTMPFRVVPGSIQSRIVRLVNHELPTDQEKGMLSYRRGLCELANDRVEKATQYLRDALGTNPGLHAARNRLVEIYFGEEKFRQVAALFPEGELTGDTDLDTLQRFMTSFEEIGELERAIQIAERGLTLWGPRPVLYKQLAHLLDRAGQPERAAEIRSSLKPETPTNP